MFKKVLFLSIITIFFIGCATTSDTVDMPKSYQEIHKNDKNISPHHFISNGTGFYKPSTFNINQNTINTTKKLHINKTLNFSGNGYIKGIIQKVYYSKVKHNWIYYIKGTDLKNNKLKYAKAYSVKKLAHINNLVYAVIKDGFISSLYLYKTSKSYKVKKKRQFANKSKHKIKTYKKAKKTPKTRERKQVISAPKVEKVIF